MSFKPSTSPHPPHVGSLTTFPLKPLPHMPPSKSLPPTPPLTIIGGKPPQQQQQHQQLSPDTTTTTHTTQLSPPTPGKSPLPYRKQTMFTTTITTSTSPSMFSRPKSPQMDGPGSPPGGGGGGWRVGTIGRVRAASTNQSPSHYQSPTFHLQTGMNSQLHEGPSPPSTSSSNGKPLPPTPLKTSGSIPAPSPSKNMSSSMPQLPVVSLPPIVDPLPLNKISLLPKEVSAPPNSPLMHRKHSIVGKVKGLLLQSSHDSSATSTQASGSIPTTASATESSTTTLSKDKIDVVAIFGLPKGEALLAEYPCAYRRHISKAGKLYITSSYICFYSMIFKSEIKECFSFRDIRRIKRVTSLVIGSSIELAIGSHKYVFGMFENVDAVHMACLRQWNHVQALSDVKPITMLMPKVSSTAAAGQEPKGRVRFTSFSIKDRSQTSDNLLVVRSRSDSMPSYSSKKKKVIDNIVHQLVTKKPSKSHQTQQQQQQDNHTTTSTSEASSTTSPTITGASAPDTQLGQKYSTPLKAGRMSLTFGKPVAQASTPSPPSSPKNNEQEFPTTVGSPPKDAPVVTRERTNTLLNIMKGGGRVAKKLGNVMESHERINKMLISRKSKEDTSQMYLREDVFGVPIEQLRVDDRSACPIFATRLFEHLEAMVEGSNKQLSSTNTIITIYLQQHQQQQQQSKVINAMKPTATATELSRYDRPPAIGMTEISMDEMEDLLQSSDDTSAGQSLGKPPSVSMLESLILQTKRGKEDCFKHFITPAHDVGDLLKHFLRSLPQPLLPEELLACDAVDEPFYKLSMVRSVIFSRHEACWSLFRQLIGHFVRLTDHHVNLYRSSIINPDMQAFGLSASMSMSMSLYPTKREIHDQLSQVFGPLTIGASLDLPSTQASIRLFNYILDNHLDILSDMSDNVHYMIKKGRQIVKTAPIDRIISKLTDVNYVDDALLDTFNLTHNEYFMSTFQYVQTLVGIFIGHQSIDFGLSWKSKLRERVLFVLRSVVETRPAIFWPTPDGNEVLRLIGTFAREETLSASKEEIKQLDYLFERSKLLLDGDLVSLSAIDAYSYLLPVGKSNVSPSSFGKVAPLARSQTHQGEHMHMLANTRSARVFDIFDADLSEIAMQVTLIDERTFKQLSKQEFLLNRFDKPEQSPMFHNMVASFNRWSSWVGSEVVAVPTPAQRAVIFERFIEIANNLLEIKNFHASYALTMGLQHYAIKRLAQSWEKVSKKSMLTFDALKALFDSDNNHRAYRERLHLSKAPLIPYVGIYSKDLFAIGDSSATLLEQPNQHHIQGHSPSSVVGNVSVLNLDKMRSIHCIINTMDSYRQQAYPLKRVDLLQQLLHERQILNDDEMYEKSLLLEHRVQQQQQP
ncbi:hypothetical protein SAMD00019534_068530 [Acytostelium subglobosum LB1]|uniref:hypothetical protein n=1 Tax=Acytostelium subglobosum LB1 TaxID=1410327 RepID=UPI0006447E75|nr:hypothetical protein SAMD00019534_068530 [Acytostelium subglobosum LB1]GAM23678.1 hypothetical protein SAMD00019534_068530 [Acytostelium subglobosum LB1]|eukprot:XP_012753419.1 hypothetical protein SAMD00019534_068530 [Acytostelium subglobosum LB1]